MPVADLQKELPEWCSDTFCERLFNVPPHPKAVLVWKNNGPPKMSRSRRPVPVNMSACILPHLCASLIFD